MNAILSTLLLYIYKIWVYVRRQWNSEISVQIHIAKMHSSNEFVQVIYEIHVCITRIIVGVRFVQGIPSYEWAGTGTEGEGCGVLGIHQVRKFYMPLHLRIHEHFWISVDQLRIRFMVRNMTSSLAKIESWMVQKKKVIFGELAIIPCVRSPYTRYQWYLYIAHTGVKYTSLCIIRSIELHVTEIKTTRTTIFWSCFC